MRLFLLPLVGQSVQWLFRQLAKLQLRQTVGLPVLLSVRLTDRQLVELQVEQTGQQRVEPRVELPDQQSGELLGKLLVEWPPDASFVTYATFGAAPRNLGCPTDSMARNRTEPTPKPVDVSIRYGLVPERIRAEAGHSRTGALHPS